MASLELGMNAYNKNAHQDTYVARNVGGSVLSLQQAVIFELLNRCIGEPVPVDTIIAVLSAASDNECPTVGSIKVQIYRVRKKVAGHYKINTIWGSGYQMHRVR